MSLDRTVSTGGSASTTYTPRTGPCPRSSRSWGRRSATLLKTPEGRGRAAQPGYAACSGGSQGCDLLYRRRVSTLELKIPLLWHNICSWCRESNIEVNLLLPNVLDIWKSSPNRGDCLLLEESVYNSCRYDTIESSMHNCFSISLFIFYLIQ